MLWHEIASAFDPEDTRTLEVQEQQLERRAHVGWLSLPEFLRDALSAEGGDIFISGDSFFSAFPWDALQRDESNGDGIGAVRAFPRCTDVTAAGLATLGSRHRSGSGSGWSRSRA